MAIIIELLNSQGQSTGIHKFNQSDIRIGRSYSNDVILLDPHSCAEHAILSCDEQGQWQLRDLNSANGTLNSQGQRVEVVPIAAQGQSFTLGKQRLRILFSDTAVAPTLPVATGWQSLGWLASTPLLITLLILVSADFAYNNWLSAIGEHAERWYRQLVILPFILLLIAFWPAFLALLARFRSQDAHFKQQASLTFGTLVIWLLWDKLQFWLGFNFSNTMLLSLLHAVIPTLILGAFFWYGFTLAGIQRKATKWVFAALLTSSYWAVPYLQSITPTLQPAYQAELLPEAWLISSPSSIDAFMMETDSLYQKAD
ncbi:FHA domain-containing protein [Alishewanella longhuensis]